jgi:hypothetical protein
VELLPQASAIAAGQAPVADGIQVVVSELE